MNTGKVLFSNNGSSRLYATVDGVSGSIRVEAGDGVKFPQPAGDGSNWFMVTLEDRRNNTIEICKCTGRSGDILNVVRAQEGTTGKTFAAGSNVSNRLTVGTMETFFQFNGYSMQEADDRFVNITGDTMTGTLVLAGPPVQDLDAATKKYVDDVSIDEAPTDGRAYARVGIDSTWLVIGTGLPEAPTDGQFYGRQNQNWVPSYTQTQLDDSFDQIGSTIGALDARVADTEQTNVDQANQITAIETKNATQDQNIAALDTKNTAQDGRLTAIEALNATQDSRLTSVEGVNASQETRLTTIEGKNSTQDADLTAIKAEQITQNNRLTSAEGVNTTQDGRLTAIEGVNASQSAAIALKIEDGPHDGLVYGRKDGNWATVIGGAHTDDAPPPAPLQDGQLWWKSSSGQLYIYYDDGNSKQWIQAAGNPTTQVGKTARARNRINNPTAQISQEYGVTAAVANAAYPADQWCLALSGIVSAGQRSTAFGPTPEGTQTCVTLTATTAKASLAAGDHLQLALPIEGFDVADFDWGTAQAKPAVLRFCAQCDVAGTYGFAITSGGADRSYCGSFTIAQAGVPQVFSFAIPGDTTGTWPVGNGLGAVVRFAYAIGSTNVGVAGWQAGIKLQPPGCANGAATANKLLYITDVGLYLDPDSTGLPPPFNAPSYEDDLARCMRYYERTMRYFLQSYTIASNGISLAHSWVVPKRATPTSAFIFNNSVSAATPVINGLTDKGFIVAATKDGVAGTFNITYEIASYARML